MVRRRIIKTQQQAAEFYSELEDEMRPLYPTTTSTEILLAVVEAVANGLKHGNKLDETKAVTVEYECDHHQFTISIEDEGCGFNISDVPNPLCDLEKPSGRGLLLIDHFMNTITRNISGNKVTMTKLAVIHQHNQNFVQLA